MTQKSQTPDERFLIKLYQAAMKKGDPLTPIDQREIGLAIGLKETAVKNIIKHLAQANFVKKVDETALRLTQRGCDFVFEAISE